MPTELRLPPLADTVTSVKLAAWLKTEGEAVAAGEPIVEVETDKTNVEIEAPADGVVGRIHVPAGTEGLETGALLAVIDGAADAAARSRGRCWRRRAGGAAVRRRRRRRAGPRRRPLQVERRRRRCLRLLTAPCRPRRRWRGAWRPPRAWIYGR